MKRILVTIALALIAFVPAVAAQDTKGFTGKWEGTFKVQRPDGTEGNPQNVVLHLTQKGKELTGTAGPGEQQWKVEKGTVDAGKAKFEVQASNGVLYKFSLSIVKGRLQGDMIGERDGETRQAKLDAERAK
jgi:hypothetical protein